MASTSLSLLFLLFLSLSTPALVQPKPLLSSPYLSPATLLFSDYEKMVANFRIYVYPPQKPFAFIAPSESMFYSSLLNSSFFTENPNEAHLFFVPFPSGLSSRSISGLVRDLRANFPYWNRALGADHFFVSHAGIGYVANRNILELKKNAVQISSFPTASGKFIPHKDVILPPLNPSESSQLALPHAPTNETAKFLGFMKRSEDMDRTQSSLVNELADDPEFLIESGPSDLRRSKFCLFVYAGDLTLLFEALRWGCVPAVITDRPIQDLPLMDVVKWSEIAVFAPAGRGARGLKEVLSRMESGGYERMRRLGMTAAQHFVWKSTPEPRDAFHMVMYQLWLRRHAIRYAPRVWA